MAARSYTDLTLKRLYSLAGNFCSYSGCSEPLVRRDANISEICHIEALNTGGTRYNGAMTDPERNAYPNLILLCRNHHGIVDEKDDDREPRYSVEQLKVIKKNHEDWYEANQLAQQNVRRPSLLGKIVKSLAAHQSHPGAPKKPLPFKIDEKLIFNKVDRHCDIVQKYSVYYPIIEGLYNEFEAAQKAAALESINDCYISNCRPNQTADDTLDRVESALIEKFSDEAEFDYSEELEWCVKIIMVDAFMRCKILEESTT